MNGLSQKTAISRWMWPRSLQWWRRQLFYFLFSTLVYQVKGQRQEEEVNNNKKKTRNDNIWKWKYVCAQSQTFKILARRIIGKLVTCHRFEVTMCCKYLLTYYSNFGLFVFKLN